MTLKKSNARQKVAIVGSGMAGLVIAHLLHHDLHRRYSVVVFESVRKSQVLAMVCLTRVC
jgi:predicted NAD/FAD-binding protein